MYVADKVVSLIVPCLPDRSPAAQFSGWSTSGHGYSLVNGLRRPPADEQLELAFTRLW